MSNRINTLELDGKSQYRIKIYESTLMEINYQMNKQRRQKSPIQRNARLFCVDKPPCTKVASPFLHGDAHGDFLQRVQYGKARRVHGQATPVPADQEGPQQGESM